MQEHGCGVEVATSIKEVPKATCFEEQVKLWRDASKSESASLHIQLRDALARYQWHAAQ